MAADDFFVDLFETAIGEDEILTEVRIPKHTGWGAHYEKFVRVAHQWPIVAVAATVTADGGTIAEARVGLTNMGSTPLRARGVEEALAGQPATEDGVRAAAERAAEGTNPPSDLNGDADYRRHLARRAHPPGRARRRGRLSLMDLTHRFTVPTPVDETWAHFQDIASVAECFPGATVTSAEGDTFAGSVKVKLGPIALVYNGSGTFVEKDEAAHRFVVDAKGKDKRGNGTAGAKVTLTMADGRVRRHRRRGGHRPGDHRQARAVRPRRDAGRLRQAARAVRGLPGGAARWRRLGRSTPSANSAAATAEPAAPDPAPAPAPEADAPAARPHPPPAKADDAINLGSTVLPVLVKTYWKQGLAALVVIVVIVVLIACDGGGARPRAPRGPGRDVGVDGRCRRSRRR